MENSLIKFTKDRHYEFAKMYYNWVCDCLTEDKMWEELALFRLGVECPVRQNELLSITYLQINGLYIENVPILKKYKGQQTQFYYNKVEMSPDTMFVLLRIWDSNSHPLDKIFKHPMRYYVKRIRTSIGDERFNGKTISGIGMQFLYDKLCKSKAEE